MIENFFKDKIDKKYEYLYSLGQNERSKIVSIVPSVFYTSKSFIERYHVRNSEDIQRERNIQKYKFQKFIELLKKYYSNEISIQDARELVYYQVKRSTFPTNSIYKNNVTADMQFVLEKTMRDPNYVRNLFLLKRKLDIKDLGVAIEFCRKYDEKEIYKQILEKCKNNEIGSDLRERIQLLCGRFPMKNDISLQEFLLSSTEEIEFDTKVDEGSLSGRTPRSSDSDITFHKYNEEIFIINNDGKLKYAKSNPGHPERLYTIYRGEIKIPENLRGNFPKIATYIIPHTGDVIGMSSGEYVSIFFPEDTDVKQQETIITMFNKCKETDRLILFPMFIDMEKQLREPIDLKDLNKVEGIEGINEIKHFLQSWFTKVNIDLNYDIEEIDLDEEKRNGIRNYYYN